MTASRNTAIGWITVRDVGMTGRKTSRFTKEHGLTRKNLMIVTGSILVKKTFKNLPGAQPRNIIHLFTTQKLTSANVACITSTLVEKVNKLRMVK